MERGGGGGGVRDDSLARLGFHPRRAHGQEHGSAHCGRLRPERTAQGDQPDQEDSQPRCCQPEEGSGTTGRTPLRRTDGSKTSRPATPSGSFRGCRHRYWEAQNLPCRRHQQGGKDRHRPGVCVPCRKASWAQAWFAAWRTRRGSDTWHVLRTLPRTRRRLSLFCSPRDSHVFHACVCALHAVASNRLWLFHNHHA